MIWRLLVDPPSDGAFNMAVDESILEAYLAAEGPRPPTLRLYGWVPPALSLGRQQPALGAHDPAFLHRCGIDLVRRPTGGRAVLHEHERTYAVIGMLGPEPFPGGVLDTYARICRALLAGLERLGVRAAQSAPPSGSGRDPGPHGPPVCFDRPASHEIVVNGRKLVGSAQLRRRRAFLQHGSIPLRLDPQRLAGAIGVTPDEAAFTDLATAAGGPVPTDALDRAIVEGFQEAFAARLELGRLGETEARRAAQLRCWKYDSVAWTLRGEIGDRERRWGPPLRA